MTYMDTLKKHLVSNTLVTSLLLFITSSFFSLFPHAPLSVSPSPLSAQLHPSRSLWDSSKLNLTLIQGLSLKVFLDTTGLPAPY